ncbi:MAG: NADH-quinone oxidoreductase subunit NuoE [Candidatus Dadabacteria bacterium]|nr:NADH-quinone oxidoreductase subunit NuoE [Candidatus Dadabacteria bacterium]
MPFSQQLVDRVNVVISKHETKRSALIPVLSEVQNEFGWLSVESMTEVAQILELHPSSVRSVATFYTMFFTKPVGKRVIWLCKTLSCALRGADKVERYVSEKLGVHTGETTSDGKIVFMETECLASCGSAPVMLAGDELYDCLSRNIIDEVIEKLQAD